MPIRIRRRHLLVGIAREQALHEFAGRGITRLKGAFGQRRLPVVQSQIPLSLVTILPMTIKTILTENRPHVMIEGNFRCRRSSQTRDRANQ
jgi:hypothetical protein